MEPSVLSTYISQLRALPYSTSLHLRFMSKEKSHLENLLLFPEDNWHITVSGFEPTQTERHRTLRPQPLVDEPINDM